VKCHSAPEFVTDGNWFTELLIAVNTWLFEFIDEVCMEGVSLPPACDVNRPSCRPRPNFDTDHINIYVHVNIFSDLVMNLCLSAQALDATAQDTTQNKTFQMYIDQHGATNVGVVSKER
jgi:hypothetical protein